MPKDKGGQKEKRSRDPLSSTESGPDNRTQSTTANPEDYVA